jgi:ATP-dependent DNA ligase
VPHAEFARQILHFGGIEQAISYVDCVANAALTLGVATRDWRWAGYRSPTISIFASAATISDASLALRSTVGQGKEISPAIMHAFDLLSLDGHDLWRAEYSTRLHLLEDVLAGHEDGAIKISEEVDADPAVLLEHACGLGLEEIVGKNRDSSYRSGKTGDWIKLKRVQSEAFFIVGYEPSGGAAFSSVLLAAYDGNDLRYVGSVGTGFREATARDLQNTMDKLI